ncbi:MAG: TonB-dependent receptor [Chitinophagales bacterium]
MYYRCIFIFLFLFISSNKLSAQNSESINPKDAPAIGRVFGKVVDATNYQALSYATVFLSNLKDSTIQYANLVDDDGKFEISTIKIGAYKLIINYLGYKDYVIEKLLIIPPDKINQDIGIIKVEEDSKVLQEVQIVGEKALMQLQADKKVFNVEKSALSAGGSVVDVLRQTPTVDVDADGNISTRGSGNLQVYINGKPSGITGANKQAVLDAIPASAIESIEIMNNPNAKFDAEGEAGIINIILKKNYTKGINGSVYVGYRTVYKNSIGASINFRKKKIGFTTSYNFKFHETHWSGYDRRKNINQDSSFFYLNTDNKGLQKHSYFNTISTQLDYDINEKNTITIGSLFGSNWRENTGTTQYNFLDENQNTYNYFERYRHTKKFNWNVDANVYYTKTFKSNKHNLIIASNYSISVDKDDPQYQQQAFLNDKTIDFNIPRSIENNKTKDRAHSYQIQADYTQPFDKSKSLLEVGTKVTYRNLINDFYADSLNRATNMIILNNGLTNNFKYQEIVNAVYGVFSGAYKKFSYKTGLRMEQTNVFGNQSVGNLDFNRHYYDFFPSIFLAQEFKNNHKLQFQYRRSINRPSAHQLNPFGEQQDPFNIRKGNPLLLPIYTNAVELSYVKNFKKLFLTTTVYYRQSKNPYTMFRTVDSTGISIIDFGNLDKGRNIGTEIIARIQLTKWWNLMANTNVFYNMLEGKVPNLEVSQDANSMTWNLRLISTMKVWKTGEIQLMWFYRGKNKFLQGEIRPMSFFNIGFRKDFLKDNKASIAFNFTDVFRTQSFRIINKGANFEGNTKRNWDSTIASITFTYKFGKQDSKPAQQQKKQDDNNQGIDGGGF